MDFLQFLGGGLDRYLSNFYHAFWFFGCNHSRSALTPDQLA